MNTTLLQDLIEEDFGYKHEGRNWGRSRVHSSLVLNEESQRWYWNSEEKGGDALGYLIQVRGMNLKNAREILVIRGGIIRDIIPDPLERQEIKPQEKLVDLMWSLGKGNRDYWYARGLTDTTIDRYRLGFYDGWSLLPLYKSDGAFANFQKRRDYPSRFICFWYEKIGFQPVLINPEVLQVVDTVFITEGAIDSILLNQEGVPSIASCGGAGYWSGEWTPMFNRVKNVYYIADNDKAGKFAAKKVAQNLGTYKTNIFLFGDEYPDKFDTVDYFRAGGNAKDFRQMVESNSKYLFEIGELNETRGKRKGSYKISSKAY